jgi:D-sedoheptulose 7-phosphate isomerase
MDYLQQLIERYPSLLGAKDDIYKAYTLLIHSFENGGKLLIAGNGGSAADAEHMVGELMKGFVKKRPPPGEFLSRLRMVDAASAEYIFRNLQGGLPAVALPGNTALMTAALNDLDADMVYAQQVYGYGNAGDAFLGISTSGNAKNVFYAMITARAKGLKTIALTGGSGGLLVSPADAAIVAPETETYKIQELHLPVYHTLCLMIEDYFFS